MCATTVARARSCTVEARAVREHAQTRTAVVFDRWFSCAADTIVIVI